MISPRVDTAYTLKTDESILGFFLRGNKVLYKTHKINFYEFNQRFICSILRYGMIFLWMKGMHAAMQP